MVGDDALVDYPHPRHACAVFKFDSTNHKQHCPNCWCAPPPRPVPEEKQTHATTSFAEATRCAGAEAPRRTPSPFESHPLTRHRPLLARLPNQVLLL